MDSESQAIATLRQYELVGAEDTEREIGRGSYALVRELNYYGLRCAGKKLYSVLYEQRVGDIIRRFGEECRLLSQLRHPSIVQFLGVYFERGVSVPVLVMEYLPTTLSQRIDRNAELGSLPDEVLYSIVADVALGINYLHGQLSPIVHRDLSANNVLLTKDLTAKISDLGVAKILHLNPLELCRLTKTPGTPCYMPPEALEESPQYDTSVDIFSYGVLLIHVFSGKWPFPTKAVTVDPEDPNKLTPVSEAERRQQYLDEIAPDHPLMDLTLKCISNSPTRRPAAAEVLHEVKDVEATFAPANKEELLQRVKALSVSLEEAEERMKRKAKIQQLSVRLEAIQKANKELDKAHDNSNTLSDSLNHSLQQVQDGSQQTNNFVKELNDHFNPNDGETGLKTESALLSTQALCSCLQRAKEGTQQSTVTVREAQQAARSYLTGLEQVKERAREKAVTVEDCHDSIQALVVDLEHSERKAQQRVDKLQGTLLVVQEQCTGLEHAIQLQETSDADTVRAHVDELHVTQDKISKLLRELSHM